MRPVERALVPAPRQQSMMFDSVTLRGLSPTERKAAILLLASLLLEAGGVAERAHDHERI